MNGSTRSPKLVGQVGRGEDAENQVVAVGDDQEAMALDVVDADEQLFLFLRGVRMGVQRRGDGLSPAPQLRAGDALPGDHPAQHVAAVHHRQLGEVSLNQARDGATERLVVPTVTTSRANGRLQIRQWRPRSSLAPCVDAWPISVPGRSGTVSPVSVVS